VIRNEVSLRIDRPVERVFAFVDDESRAADWLSRCVALRQVTPGAKGVGTELHYTYKDPGRTGEMDGRVTAYEKDRRLAMHYTDPTFDVDVDFWFEPEREGTTVRHATSITPKSLMAKLMTPIIRGATGKQIVQDTQALKRILESDN
jgi:uncharacterized protein YndB with AHSA1/START domain